jgi:peroxiredoxin Q/BCP
MRVALRCRRAAALPDVLRAQRREARPTAGGLTVAFPSGGDPAPDFTLAGTPGGRRYSLSDYRGRAVVLVFYPNDDTPVCTTQLVSYNADLEQFADLGAEVLGLSPQDVESHERFAEEHGLDFPLLADADKEVGRAYGLVGPLGFYKRSVFVVDGAGIVRYAHRSAHGLTYRRSDELVAAVRTAMGQPAG